MWTDVVDDDEHQLLFFSLMSPGGQTKSTNQLTWTWLMMMKTHFSCSICWALSLAFFSLSLICFSVCSSTCRWSSSCWRSASSLWRRHLRYFQMKSSQTVHPLSNVKRHLILTPEVVFSSLLYFLHSVDLPIHRTLLQQRRYELWFTLLQ